MKGFSEKIFLSLKMPTEEQPVSVHRRLELALQELGYHPVQLSQHILRRLYPLCRRAEFDVTATLVHRENERVVTDMQLPPIPDFSSGCRPQNSSPTRTWDASRPYSQERWNNYESHDRRRCGRWCHRRCQNPQTG